MKPRLILASASPRRRLLLEEAGYLLEVDPSGFEEPEPGPRASPSGLRGASGLAEGGGGRPAAQYRTGPGGRYGVRGRRRDSQQAARSRAMPNG